VPNWAELKRYWGKAGDISESHPLVYHQLDVAAAGVTLLDAMPQLHQRLTDLSGFELDLLRHWIGFFLALHDLGKFSSSFQQLRADLFPIRSGESFYTIRHDTLGHLAWRALFADDDQLIDRLAVWPGDEDPVELIDSWVQCVMGHHGQPPSLQKAPLSDHFSREDQQAMAAWVGMAAELLLPRTPQKVNRSLDDLEQRMAGFSWYLAGLCTLADWLGSNRDHFPYCTEDLDAKTYLQRHAIPNARRAVGSSGLIPAETAEFTDPVSLFDFLKKPTPLQSACLELPIGNGAQLHILEDVTGSGKTEAAVILLARIMAAHKAQGAYIALPTMATANAMYSRTASVYRKLFGQDGPPPSLVLAHGGRHLDGKFQDSLIHPGPLPREGQYELGEFDAEARCNAWLADNNKKALLAQVGVGTIDQALLAVLQSRHQSLRLLGLVGKVLIVDEVHASDEYMHTLLCQLLCLHARSGGSAILLSATLPASMRSDLIQAFGGTDLPSSTPPEHLDYPLLTSVSPSEAPRFWPVATRESVRRRLEIQLFHDEGQALDWILEQADQGRSVAWIRNTVNDAITAWQRLSAKLGDDRVMLFHARFAMGDRLDIERKVLSAFGSDSTTNTRAGRVVIATQVIEQSLDLDFDEMVSDLAPIDLLLQRAGRLKRHIRDHLGSRLGDRETDQRGPPCLHVLAPPPDEDADAGWIRRLLPGAGTVYPDHGRLWLTASELSTRGAIRVPEDLRELIESVYGESAVDRIPTELAPSNARAEGKALSDRSVARLNAIKLATGYTCQDGQWADESKTPTRLGDPSVTIRLARWQDGAITPWYNQETNAWPLSELKIAARLFSEPVLENPDLRRAVEDLRATWPRAIRHMQVLPFSMTEDRWVSTAHDAHGRVVRFEYSPVVGLQILKEEIQ